MPWHYKLLCLTSLLLGTTSLSLWAYYERFQVVFKTTTSAYIAVFIFILFISFFIYFIYLSYKRKLSQDIVYALFFLLITTSLINFIFMLNLIKHFIEISTIFENRHFGVYKMWYPGELHAHAQHYCSIYKVPFEIYKEVILKDAFTPEIIEARVKQLRLRIMHAALSEEESIFSIIWNYIRSFFW
jgi:hypothetical protein